MKLPYFLRVLFTPSCWLQNGVYCAEWDADLNARMKCHAFEPYGPHTGITSLGGRPIWVENHPYASFRPLVRGDYDITVLLIRPKRRTILKAMDKLCKDITQQLELTE